MSTTTTGATIRYTTDGTPPTLENGQTYSTPISIDKTTTFRAASFSKYGFKGIGELPMDGPAPAILNAIHDAVGISLRRIPATPEVLFDAMEGKGV